MISGELQRRVLPRHANLRAGLLLCLRFRVWVIGARERLVARLLPGRLERLGYPLAPRDEVIADQALKPLLHFLNVQSCVTRPLDDEVGGVVPPEQRVRAALPDDGHDPVALEQVAQRT